jgi:glycosyltransferase involved in cell wall biosynthesis
VPRERIEIVINGVPEPTVARRVESGVPGRVQRVLFVGNLSERKGVSDLLHAMAQAPLHRVPLELVLAGGGDVEGYAALASRLGLDGRVRFNGWTGQQALAELLAQADVLVLPSHDEGLPLAILEALAHGVAVVCTPVGEIPHVLTDGQDACFVEAGDPESIAEGLLRVLKDRWLREMLERNGRALFEQRFSLDRFSASVARIHRRHFGVCSPAGQAGAAPRSPE